MSDTLTTEENKVTAGFSLKVPGEVQYSSSEASVFVPLTIPEGSSQDDIEALAHQAMAIAKRIVAAAQGVTTTTEVTDTGDERVILDIKDAFPGTTEVKTTGGGGGNRGGGQRRSGGGTTDKVTVGRITILKPINDDDLSWVEERWAEAVDAGKIDESDNELWDNRKFLPAHGGNGNPNAPHFKTAKDKKGVWPS